VSAPSQVTFEAYPRLVAGEPARRPRRPNPYDTPWRRVRRVAAVGAAIVLVPALISYAASMLARSDSSVPVRSVEWLRDNGARGLVDRVESFYYSLTAPAKGGPALRRLPKQAGATVAATGSATGTSARTHSSTARVRVAIPHYEPPAIKPLIAPALPGEGVWRAPFHGLHERPPVLVTSFRSNPAYPQMVAGVAWIDHTETSTMLYPGIQEPSVVIARRGPEEVPPSLRYKLLATFNSAFKLSDSGGGYGENGVTYAAMHDGEATIVRFRNGRVDVIGWRGGPRIGRNIAFARQNLQLIVEGGRPNPNLSDGPEWGATLGNAIQVWRSSVGIDRHGNLIYAAADYQTVGSLAQIMIRAGAVRAMELDINAYWPSFITYTGAGAIGAANLLPSMTRSPERYLTPDDRDFFAVYLRGQRR
jgi:hypothetical protein